MAGTALKRVGIDARMYGLEHAGIGRYVMNLVDRELVKNVPYQWVVFCSPDKVAYFKQYPHVEIISSGIRHYSYAEQIQWVKLLNGANLDLLHVPHFNVPLLYTKPFVVTIHDILWHHVKGGSVTTLSPLTYYLKYCGYQLIVRHAVLHAQNVIVPSYYVKQDLLEAFHSLQEKKITVTYEGVTSQFSAVSTETNDKVKDPYLLYIGSAYPHKNISIIFKALELLHDKLPELKLVLVGSRSVFLDRLREQLATSAVKDQVIFGGSQSDRDITNLLHHAVALVHPSKSEGFGLTGLEAMAADCPVIAARASCLPEIYGEAALYFDPDNAQELASRVIELYQNDQVKQQYLTLGLDQVKKYSWDTMTDQTLKVYEGVIWGS